MSLAEQLSPAQRSVAPRFGEQPAPHKIGLIALSSDMVTERDFSLMLPPGGEVMYYTSRVPLAIPVTVENLRLMGPKLAEAASLILPTSKLDVIAYSCTSASVAIGPEEVAAQIQKGRPGVEVVTPISAATAAFEACNVRRISLLTPYTEDVTKAMAIFIRDQGIEVLNFAHFDLVDDQDMARLTPEGIHDAAVETVHTDADAIFVSCTGVRTAETIKRLEETLDKPVFCSNQCMFWQALRLSGYDKPVAGFGRLLTL
jgi:maleate isomerase